MPAKQQQQGSFAPLVVAVAVAAAAVAGWFGYPAVVVVAAGVTIAGWFYPPPVLTGKKDAAGFPTVASQAESVRLRWWRWWTHMRWAMLVPHSGWLPGWPVMAAWIAGVAVAAGVAHLPVNAGWMRAANAAAGFVIVVTVCNARRKAYWAGCPSPGVRVDTLTKLTGVRAATVAVLAVSVGAGAVAAWQTATALTPDLLTVAPAVDFEHTPVGRLPGLMSPVTAAAAVGVLTFALAAGFPWQRAALAHWRMVVAQQAVWKPRWQALKHDPAPTLVDHRQVGRAVVEVFDAPAGAGAQAFWSLAHKIAPAVGAGAAVYVLAVPDENKGQPIVGSRHPLRFQIVQWSAGSPPDLADPNIGDDEAALAAECLVTNTLDGAGYARPVLADMEKVSVDGSAAVWSSRWVWPDGPGLAHIVQESQPLVPDGAFLADHKHDVVYLGAVDDGDVEFADDTLAGEFDRLRHERHWRGVWTHLINAGEVPTLQHTMTRTEQLVDGNTVTTVPFVTRQGMPPSDFFGKEAKLATALSAAPFVSITGWTGTGGERHPQAIQVAFAAQPVPPTPQRLPASPAASLVLAGQFNAAFDAAKLARPEVVTCRALTGSQSDGVLWRAELRLFDGVTVAGVRDKAAKLQTTLSVDWLRIAEEDDMCVVYAGAAPADATLARPQRDQLRLTQLDWEQAWVDAKVIGAAGKVPQLADLAHMPANPDMQTLTFDVPAGIDPETVKGAVGKLSTATGNEFVQVRPGQSASQIQLLVCEHNPLPTVAHADFGTVDTSGGIPFATGVDGQPAVFDPAMTPHALVAGKTGSGKSAAMRALLYGAVASGWECYVADPEKFGADFQFAEPYCTAIAGDLFAAERMLKHVYQQVNERKKLNAEHKTVTVGDLPDDVRPPPIALLVDEFTSLIGQDQLPPVSDDPTVNEERELGEARNAAKATIGTLTSKIAREARSAGVILWLGTQKLTAKTLEQVPGGNDLKDNLGTLLLGATSPGARTVALKSPFDAPKLPEPVPVGRGVWESGSAGVEIVQVWYAEPDEFAEALRSRRAPLDNSEKFDLSAGAEDQRGSQPGSSEPVALGQVSLDELEQLVDDAQAS